MSFKGSRGARFRVQGSGFKVQVVLMVLMVLRVVQCIIIWKRRGVLEYTLFAKDEKPVNLLNLQNPLNL